MINDKFWNECLKGSIREKVAEFLDKSPLLSKLKGDDYYAVEDEIVDFIHSNRDSISDEVIREYHRDDVITCIEEHLGLDDEADVSNYFSLEEIDDLVDAWQERLANTDDYWDTTNQSLYDVLSEDSKFKQAETKMSKE